MSSDVQRLPLERVDHELTIGRWESTAGVVPATVNGAKVDRLEWTEQPRRVRRSAPGRVRRTPVARGTRSTLHRALDPAGFPCLVRRTRRQDTLAFAEGHRIAANLLTGVEVPALVAVERGHVWMDEPRWAPVGTRANPGAVDDHVTDALRNVVQDGTIIGTGTVHVAESDGLVCEDVVVAYRLDVDERALFRALVVGLASLDPIVVADTVADLCHHRPTGLAQVTTNAIRSLEARWTPVAVGLAVHGLGRVALRSGTNCDPLVLLGDELLHRLDLAHEHRRPVPGLSSPCRLLGRLDERSSS